MPVIGVRSSHDMVPMVMDFSSACAENMFIPTIAAAQSAFHSVFIRILLFWSLYYEDQRTAGAPLLRGEGSSLAASTQFLQTDHRIDAEPGERLRRKPGGLRMIHVFLEIAGPGPGRQFGGHHAGERALDRAE